MVAGDGGTGEGREVPAVSPGCPPFILQPSARNKTPSYKPTLHGTPQCTLPTLKMPTGKTYLILELPG